MRSSMRVRFGVGLALAAFFGARGASATTVLETGDNGSEQMGRGGAWVARASDPLAAFYNPAGLAGQDTRLTLQANFNMQSTCFTRLKSANDATIHDGIPANQAQTVAQETISPGNNFQQVCNNSQPFPDPQLAFTYRLTPRIGLGFAVLGPSAAGQQSWPSTMPDGSPAPQRYLLVSANTLLLTPTLGVGWEPIDNLRIGASFLWGIANLDFANYSAAQNAGNLSTNPASTVSAPTNDVRGEIKVAQAFIPGFTAGTIWSPTDQIDIAGWYKFMSSIDAKGNALTSVGTGKNTVTGDTSLANCGSTTTPPPSCPANAAEVKINIPMEAKIGFRFHKVRADVDTSHRRDPMSTDVFDIEADLTWANNSQFKNIQINFPALANGTGTIPVNGTPGYLPPDASVPHNFQDVWGARFGGDYNILPGSLAIRAGGYFQTAAQGNQQYQNIDFAGTQEFGLALGGTWRIRLGHGEKPSAIELSAGFGHTFIADTSNNTQNGVAGLAGTQCNTNVVLPGGGVQPNPTTGSGPCADGKQQYRTEWPVNLGTITNSFTQINIGASYRF
jgi:long-subunit fatty acid transport protein